MNHPTPIITILTILTLTLISHSCKLLKPSTSNDFSSDESRPMIVFLNCSLVYDSIRQEHNMSLINKIIVDGGLKKNAIDFEVREKGDFRYSALSKNLQVIFQKYMQFPLDKTIEYVDERGNLQKKDIRLDSTQFSLRISLTSEVKYISFDIREKQLLLINLEEQ